MIPPSPIRDFYSALPSFAEFREFTQDAHFTRVPDDWFVVITDVKGSTKAIEAGRYKDVNTIGAASISVVTNLLGRDFPFVFGGDGATMLVPPDTIDRVLDSLMGLQQLSLDQFAFELRVGHIQVGEVHQTGTVIEVAKHELTASRCVAVFRGGGLNEAERLIKTQETKYCVQADTAKTAGTVELSGLSCRWNPLPNRRGRIMALLVCAQSKTPAVVYDALLVRLNELYNGHLDAANPVNTDIMHYKSMADCVKDETRYHTRKTTLAWLKRLFEIVAAVLIFKHRIPPMIFDAAAYRASMHLHADHRKFDDMLRMILDCSEEQASAILSWLEERRERGELCYGTHLADNALMTCYVQDVQDGQHIHFIDGGDGGYAMAAKQLKQQLNRTQTDESG